MKYCFIPELIEEAIATFIKSPKVAKNSKRYILRFTYAFNVIKVVLIGLKSGEYSGRYLILRPLIIRI